MKKSARKLRALANFTRNSNTGKPTRARRLYIESVTTDPTEVNEAWDALSSSQFAREVSNYPVLMHSALAEALNKKAKNARK